MIFQTFTIFHTMWFFGKSQPQSFMNRWQEGLEYVKRRGNLSISCFGSSVFKSWQSCWSKQVFFQASRAIRLGFFFRPVKSCSERQAKEKQEIREINSNSQVWIPTFSLGWLRRKNGSFLKGSTSKNWVCVTCKRKWPSHLYFILKETILSDLQQVHPHVLQTW